MKSIADILPFFFNMCNVLHMFTQLLFWAGNHGVMIRVTLLSSNNLTQPNLTQPYLRDHSSITSAERWMGGVRKWLIYSTIHADVGGWA